MKIVFKDFTLLNLFRPLSPGEIAGIDKELEIVAFPAFRREFVIIPAVLLTEHNEGVAEVPGIGVLPLFIPYLVGDAFISHFLDLMLGDVPATVTEIEILLVTGRGDEVRLDEGEP